MEDNLLQNEQTGSINRINFMQQQISTKKSYRKIAQNNVQQFRKTSESFQSIIKNSNFDRYTNQIDFEVARQHAKAVRVCKTNLNPNRKICICCEKTYENEQFSLCDDPDQLVDTGISFPLYFTFIKQCAAMMFFLILFNSIPNLLINAYQGDLCDSVMQNSLTCKLSFLNILITNNQKNPNNSEKTIAIYLQQLLNCFSVIIMVFLAVIFQVYQKLKSNNLTKKRATISQYSILIKHLPYDITEIQLLQFLEKAIPDSSLDIDNLIMINDMTELSNIQKQINQYHHKKYLIQADKPNNYEKQVELLDLQIENLEKHYQELIDDLLDQSEQKTEQLKFTGNIIITFKKRNTQKQIELYFKPDFVDKICLYFYKRGFEYFKIYLKKFILRDKVLSIKRAPEPSDIKWFSIGCVKKENNVLISNIMIFSVIILDLFLVVSLKTFVRKFSGNINYLESGGLNLIVALIIAGCNVLLGILIRRRTQYEQKSSQTGYFIRVGSNLITVFFINMIVVVVFANYLEYKFTKDSIAPEIQFIHFDLPNLLNELFFMFVTSTYISSFCSIFDIVWGYKLYKRYKLKKDLEKNKNYYTQEDVNTLMQGHPIDMGLRYANVLKNINYTLAIAGFLPIGTILCFMGLFVIYWCDKWLIMRRMVCQNYLSENLNKRMLKKLNFSIFFYALGCYVIQLLPLKSITDQGSNVYGGTIGRYIIPMIGFVLAFLHLLNNSQFTLYSYLKNLILKDYDQKLNYHIDEVRDEFLDDYEIYHPGLRENKLKTIRSKEQNN